MLAAGWSMKLVGLAILLATWAAPAAGSGTLSSLRGPAEAESKPVDLSANFRFILGPPDSTGNLDVCLGTRVAIAGTDPNKRAAAVADLESRRDFVSKAFHEHFGNSSHEVRALDILNGDIAAVCIGAPSSSQSEVLSVVLEFLRPTTLTVQRWSEFVQRWRNRDGLASAAIENPLQNQLQSLIWLGNPEATVSVARVIEHSLELNPDRVAHSAVRPTKVVLSTIGDYSPADLEKLIRSHPLVREFTRSPSAAPGLPGPAEPKLQTPRFMWERTETPDGHVWLFGWPIVHLDATHAASLDVLAQMLERHLNEQTPIGKSGTVDCAVESQRQYGSFIIEVRSKSLDLATVDKWVRSGMDWLKSGQFSSTALSTAIESTKHSFTDPIERAFTVLARSYQQQESTLLHSSWSLTPSDISRLAQRDFDPRRSSEIFAEAIPPRATVASAARRASSITHRPKGSRAGASAVQTNRRPGRMYTVQAGESLQMVAHRFRVTLAEIIRENRLSHPDQIRPGTKIFVPQPESSVKLAK